MKICTKCKETFPFSGFRKQSSTKDGLKYYCKGCDDEIAKRYYEKNKINLKKNIKFMKKKQHKIHKRKNIKFMKKTNLLEKMK